MILTRLKTLEPKGISVDMTSGITVNATRAVRKFKILEKSLDADVALTLIGQRELKWINKNFKAHGIEKPWKPLSKNTIASRRGGGGGAQPLRDTGRLAQSFVSVVKKPSVSVGTKNKIAIFHEKGTKPYTIRPKKAGGMLAFMTTRGPALARVVNHPGLPKRQMLPSKQVATFIAFETMTKIVENAISKGNQGTT
jgi:phage gpG-like protein